MSELLTLKGTNGVSEIHIESGLLARAASVIGETFSPSRIHIVSDSTVAPLYLEQLEQQFTLPVTHTVIPAGEEHKRLSTVESIYHDLLASGMTRKDLIIALGGGVSQAGEFLLNAVRERMPGLVFYKEMPYARIELAQLGNDAGIIGAAMLGK